MAKDETTALCKCKYNINIITLLCASNSTFYPLTLCTLKIVFMIMIVKYIRLSIMRTEQDQVFYTANFHLYVFAPKKVVEATPA